MPLGMDGQTEGVSERLNLCFCYSLGNSKISIIFRRNAELIPVSARNEVKTLGAIAFFVICCFFDYRSHYPSMGIFYLWDTIGTVGQTNTIAHAERIGCNLQSRACRAVQDQTSIYKGVKYSSKHWRIVHPKNQAEFAGFNHSKWLLTYKHTNVGYYESKSRQSNFKHIRPPCSRKRLWSRLPKHSK